MFLFPLIDAVFFIILYRIHKRIFWITLGIEAIVYFSAWYYIESNFALWTNRTLYWLAVTGICTIIVFIAFFIAISLNHQELYAEDK